MKILCWIGFHDWRYHGDYIQIRFGRVVQFHICKRCGGVDAVFNS